MGLALALAIESLMEADNNRPIRRLDFQQRSVGIGDRGLQNCPRHRLNELLTSSLASRPQQCSEVTTVTQEIALAQGR
jgi:hypothetical protein